MLHHSAAVIFVILAWWLSTGAVLYAAGREEPRVVPVMAGASILAAAGFVALWFSLGMADIHGVWLGFLGALGIWAWHEASFLTGVLTGPRREPCPPGLRGYGRFKAAFEAIRDHELAIAATGIGIVAISWGADNRIGMWTFLLLWGMRISAKLILFLGAPHVAVAMLPRRLAYMASYFRMDRVSAVLPAFIIAMTFGFVLLCHAAATAEPLAEAVTATILATFLALAIAEHLFLVLPVSDAALWRWAMPAGEGASAPAPHKQGSGPAVAFAGSGVAVSHKLTGVPAADAGSVRKRQG